MRTNEQRLAALHARGAQLQKARRDRRVLLLSAVGTAVCLGAALLPVLLAPDFPGETGLRSAGNAISASLFAESPVLYTLAIVIVAFLLGVTATLFCLRLRAWHERQEAALRQEEAETRQSEEIQ